MAHRFGPHLLLPSQIFYESAHALAVVNIRPVLPGHVLVISRRAVARFGALSAVEVADVWSTAQLVGRVVTRCHGGAAATYSMQDGAEAGQSVPHLHVHIVPRRARDLPHNDQVYDLIEGSERELGAPGGPTGGGSGGGGARAGLAVDPVASAAVASAPRGGSSDDILPAEQRKLRTPAEMAAEADVYRAAFAQEVAEETLAA